MINISVLEDELKIGDLGGFLAKKLSYSTDNSNGIFRILLSGKKILARHFSRFGANSLNELVQLFEQLQQQAIDNGLKTSITPIINKIAPQILPTNETLDIEIEGDNFSYDGVLSFDSSVTVNSTQVVSPNRIVANITTTTDGNVPINFSNGDTDSNVWGIQNVEIIDIPNGASLLFQSASSTNPNKYTGVPFARSTRNSLSVSRAFDNNNATSIERDNADTNAGWFVGIMMSQPTLLESVTIQTRRGSTGITIQGSNDTTDGTDGTWTDITTFTGLYPVELPVVGIHIYTAFRAVFPTPSSIPSSLRCGAREVYFTGKQ